MCFVKTQEETPRGSQKPALELKRQTFTWSCRVNYSFFSSSNSVFIPTFLVSVLNMLLFVLLRNIFGNLHVEVHSY